MELKYDVYIAAQPEEVWDAFMSPEGTRKIFFGSALKTTFNVGDSFAYVGPGNDGDETVHLYGEILAYEPQRLFSFLEHPGPSYQANHAELESRVTITLEPLGKVTKLTLINDQWTRNHPSYKKAEETWWIVLSNIKTLAETGKTLELDWSSQR